MAIVFRLTAIRSLVDLAFLYGGKVSTVLVALIALPWYQKLLGSEAFGLVAVILSIQAFLVLMDLGMSTVVNREIAYGAGDLSDYDIFRASILVLNLFYAAILLIALVGAQLSPAAISLKAIFLSVVCFWAVTMQNVAQSALLAKRLFFQAGFNQTVGVLVRAALTIGSLLAFESTIEVFLLAQAGTAVFHLLSTLLLCSVVMDRSKRSLRSVIALSKTLALQGRPLVLFGLAGAAALQLDKVILAFFNPPEAVAEYYLASVLCLTPISVLAAPIAQFFQPQIIRAVAKEDVESISRLSRRLTATLILVVGVVSTVLWLYRDIFLDFWLHGSDSADAVSSYVAVMLPGVALGSLGYVPFSLLTAQQDYSFQAILSSALTIGTLMIVAFAAFNGSVIGVCSAYVAYHIGSAVFSWIRAIRLQPKTSRYAVEAAFTAIKGLAALSLPVAVIVGLGRMLF